MERSRDTAEELGGLCMEQINQVASKPVGLSGLKLKRWVFAAKPKRLL
jgi:hypothetical protein